MPFLRGLHEEMHATDVPSGKITKLLHGWLVFFGVATPFVLGFTGKPRESPPWGGTTPARVIHVSPELHETEAQTATLPDRFKTKKELMTLNQSSLGIGRVLVYPRPFWSFYFALFEAQYPIGVVRAPNGKPKPFFLGVGTP